ncbi:hypothetical protein [Deinococcus arcticus]|uniref:hypothetical protein n=1 Tax=Deinococcus arcticus TaxID=2136176 RepID=UPI0011B23165|nr:hypothetical protein [Deinococcus arcticus]
MTLAWSGWAKTGALTQEGWPASWLLLAYWGCDVHSVLDLDTGRVGLCDLDAVEDFEAPGEALLWQTPDLSTWLRAWAQGESLFFDMAGEG